MYDGGNYLFTNLGSYIPYSNAGVATDPAFGPAGRYFTRKYPGLFVAVADLDGVGTFGIDGNLGADGSGYVDGAILEYRAYGTLRGYTKLAFGAQRVINASRVRENQLIGLLAFALRGHADRGRVECQ